MRKVFALLLLAAAACSAGNITYNVNLTVGAGGITGNIVTDGATGLLSVSGTDILSFNLLLNDGTNTFDIAATQPGTGWPSAPADGLSFFGSSGLSATATELLFNFSGSGDLLFQHNIGSSTPGGPFVCFEGTTNCSGTPRGIQLSATPGFGNEQFAGESETQVIGTTASTPEPSSFVLFGAGIALLGLRKRTPKILRND